MDQIIEEARYRAESATAGVGDLLNEGTQKLEEAHRILQGCDELKPWNIISQYQVGKSAKKTADEIAKLRDVAKSIRIADPPPPPAMIHIPREPTTEFESRRRVEDDIIESLKHDHVRMIAVCGPGGVGKTTMVQRIVERVRNKLFDEVVTVVVSQKINMLNIQKGIAEILGLNLRESTLVARAHKICTRLLDSTTKLLIFDDVWESFSLNDIGVPLGNGSERCKIILTSRLKVVCEEMDADRVIQIEVLNDEESWRLFREKSGVREDDSELYSIAKAIAAECKGLPIALVPIAKTLKNKERRTWEDSLLQLKRANPTDFPKVLEDVYMPLKLSYDSLETKSEKSLFLLCCLFPEDYDITIELLALYSIRLALFEDMMNINEGRSRTHNMVERLKSCFLLIEGHREDTVKMHDVVRDVAIFIGSKENNGFLKSLQVFSEDSPSLDSSRQCHWMSTDTLAEEIAKLRDVAKSIRISDPPPPPSVTPIPHEPTTEFESRRPVEEDIIQSLKDDRVQIIAVCGPGGVGKTTMVQRIMERVRNKLFDEVVRVVVGPKINMLNIQKEIAEILGLNLGDTTLVVKAHKIRTRLADSRKKLLIFDDVWKSFSLKDIGVPLDRCKIILTSRLKDVCKEMDAQTVIQIEVLDDEESWRLFREKSGVREDDFEFGPIANALAAECKGLPIALVSIAKALKNKDRRTWEVSLSQLKRPNPTNFSKVPKDVYMPLKLSYDSLETKSEKSLFLLCCLFPKGYDIPIELLTLYSIGLPIFEEMININEGRNRTHCLVERLKSRFLLMDGRRKDTVTMHDVVRDVAIFIGSKENHGFLKSLQVFSKDSPSLDSSCNCHWMSTDTSIVNVRSAFPNLRLLVIQEPKYRTYEDYDDNIDFEVMKEMKVLSYSNIKYLTSFPPTLKLLKILSTLHLENSGVKDISVVGELTNLKILYIRKCLYIEELPANIGKLNRLRLLELRDCENVERATEGVISSLVGLEELKIVGSFDKWGAKVNGSEERNASLLELESLPNLTWLEIDISDSNFVAQDICLSQRLARYWIYFTEARHQFIDMEYERNIYLNLPGDIAVGNWIHQLVRNAQSLRLTGDGSNYFNLDEIESLKMLRFTNCSTVTKIDCKFPALEKLCLRDLPELANLRSPNQNVSLANLKKIIIHDCPNLCDLFSLGTALSLVQLLVLDIERCGMIEQMFWNEIESNVEVEIIEFPRLTELKIFDCPKLRTKIGNCPNLQTIQLWTFNGMRHLLSSRCTRTWITQVHKLFVIDCDTIEELLVDEIEDEENRHIIFPKLEELSLRDLPCLTTFYRGVESIKFPKLSFIEIENLPRLNKLAPMDSEPTNDDRCLHFVCNRKVEFSCLETLHIGKLQDTIDKIWCRLAPINLFHKLKSLAIYDVNGIRNLMSSSIAQNLVNLSFLSIVRCQEMIEVVEKDKEISVTSLFPKLNHIYIDNLYKLKSFCQWEHALEFVSLVSVEIVDCPRMETFSRGPIRTPCFGRKDLNDSINELFRTKSSKKTESTSKKGKETKGRPDSEDESEDKNDEAHEDEDTNCVLEKSEDEDEMPEGAESEEKDSESEESDEDKVKQKQGSVKSSVKNGSTGKAETKKVTISEDQSSTSSKRSSYTGFLHRCSKIFAKIFSEDLTPRKSSINVMIQEELTKLADSEDDEGDTEKDGKKASTRSVKA